MQPFIAAREKYFQEHLLDRAGVERLREKIEAEYLILHKALDWIHRHNLMPLAFPTPEEFDVEPWAMEVFKCLVNPCPMVKIVERFMSTVALEALATLIAQAEKFTQGMKIKTCSLLTG